MKQLIRSEFQREGYQFAKSPEEIAESYGFAKVARLGSNENPYPPSPAVIKAAAAALSTVNRYPDPKGSLFQEAVRRYVFDHCVVTSGLGMDGVIETVVRTLVDPNDKVVISTPTFSMYGLAARAASAKVVSVPRQMPKFTVDTDAFIAEAKDAKLSFLCTPNNPTGTVTNLEAVEEILQNISGVLFLDNAYVEFSEVDYLPLLKKYENLVIGRTLSKVYGLAGLRLGYGFVPEWLKAPYEAAATPFTLTKVSETASAAALSETLARDEFVQYVKFWRETFVKKISYPTLPSGANFVLVNVSPLTGSEAAERLAQQGVLVRSGAGFPGLGDTYIRVSVGGVWENERFLSAVNNL